MREAVQGPVSRLRLHDYICAPWEALACAVPKWDAFWVAPPRRHADFSPGSCRLWKALLTRFLVHRFMAQLQAVSLCSPNMFGQTALGPCRHLLVTLLGSCRAEFLGQKGLVKSGTRQCEEQSVVGFICLTSTRHDGASAVCEA